MPDVTLETPESPASLYMARGADVDAHRPLFTGDVLRGDDSELIVLQHPCALRRGADLNETLLCAPVAPRVGARSNWSAESSRIMPLPDLRGDGRDYSADFVALRLLSDSEARALERIATLSEVGVNLLLQRWVFHNSRVIIKTVTFQEQIAGPFSEADLIAEWCADLEDGETSDAAREAEFHSWIREMSSTTPTKRRQDMLDDPQSRSAIRRELRDELRTRAAA